MGSVHPGAGTTAGVVRLRERVGVGALALLGAWLAYVTGVVGRLFELFDAIESELWRVAVAASLVAGGALAAAHARSLGAAAWPLVRRLIDRATPVLPESVTRERLGEVEARLAAVERKVADVAALRAGREAAVADAEREEEALLREARDPASPVDEATLGRRINRAGESLRLRREQLDEVRADEEALLDARGVCDLCAQRLRASLERYRSAVAVARTVTGLRALVGAPREADEASLALAERQCMAALGEVDALMANLDVALYERKLDDRVAALRVAELRQAAVTTAVRVDAREGRATGAATQAEARARGAAGDVRRRG